MRGVKIEPFSEGFLREEYITKNKSIQQISRETSVSSSVLSRWIKGYNIKKTKELIKESCIDGRREGAKNGKILKEAHLEKLKKELIGKEFCGRIIEGFHKRDNNQFYWRVRCLRCGKICYMRTSEIKVGPRSCECSKTILVKKNGFSSISLDCVLMTDDKGNICKIDADSLDKVKEFYWKKGSRGYWWATNKSLKYGFPSHLLLARFLLGAKNPEIVIDHKNRDINDNRKENLRACTSEENSYNRGKIDGKRLYKGVTSVGEKYRVNITLKGITYELGYYNTPEQGAAEYNLYAKILFNDFACPNQEVEQKGIRNLILFLSDVKKDICAFVDSVRDNLACRGFSVLKISLASYLKEFYELSFYNIETIIRNIVSELCGEYDYILITDIFEEAELKTIIKQYKDIVKIVYKDFAIDKIRFRNWSENSFVFNIDNFSKGKVGDIVEEIVKNPLCSIKRRAKS